MYDDASTESLQTLVYYVDKTTKTTLVANFIANVLISGALNYLWGMVNCLQIIAHYPMINVLMPANCQLLFTVVVKIATFDLIPVDGIMELIGRNLHTSQDAYKMPGNFEEFGYETTDPIQN